MKSWAILGDFSFDIISSPHVYSLRSASSWAEHPLVQGKPKLEWIGDELDEITFEVLFHNHLVKPETQLRLLREAKARHQPMALVMGDGDYKGPYVITNIDTNVNTTTPGGRIRSATVNMTLREYTGDFIRPAPSEGILDALLTYVDAKTGTNLKNTVQQAVGYARTAINVVNAGIEVINDIKGSSLPMLESVSELSSIINSAIAPLEQLAALTDGNHDLANGGCLALDALYQADSYLKGNGLTARMDRIDAVAGCMTSAAATLSSTQSAQLALSISIATRSVLS